MFIIESDDLLDAIKDYNRAADDDSNDKHIAAANTLQTSAMAFMRAVAKDVPGLARKIDRFLTDNPELAIL